MQQNILNNTLFKTRWFDSKFILNGTMLLLKHTDHTVK